MKRIDDRIGAAAMIALCLSGIAFFVGTAIYWRGTARLGDWIQRLAVIGVFVAVIVYELRHFRRAETKARGAAGQNQALTDARPAGDLKRTVAFGELYGPDSGSGRRFTSEQRTCVNRYGSDCENGFGCSRRETRNTDCSDCR